MTPPQLIESGTRILSNPTLPATVPVPEPGRLVSAVCVWEGGAVLRGRRASRNTLTGPASRLCAAAHNLRTVAAFPSLPPASHKREAN